MSEKPMKHTVTRVDLINECWQNPLTLTVLLFGLGFVTLPLLRMGFKLGPLSSLIMGLGLLVIGVASFGVNLFVRGKTIMERLSVEREKAIVGRYINDIQSGIAELLELDFEEGVKLLEDLLRNRKQFEEELVRIGAGIQETFKESLLETSIDMITMAVDLAKRLVSAVRQIKRVNISQIRADIKKLEGQIESEQDESLRANYQRSLALRKEGEKGYDALEMARASILSTLFDINVKFSTGGMDLQTVAAHDPLAFNNLERDFRDGISAAEEVNKEMKFLEM